MIWFLTVLYLVGMMSFIFLGVNHIHWLFRPRSERKTWPWNWRLLTPTTKYIDWRYDNYGYNGKRMPQRSSYRTGGPVPFPLSSLPERNQADPYVGYKTLALVIDEGRIRCKGCTGSIYDIEAVASCNIPTLYYGGITSGVLTVAQARAFVQALGQESAITDLTHKSPDPLCRCGFYALAERPGDWEYGLFMAQVELYGRVVRGERGYRAERQRVLSLEARRICTRCKQKAHGFAVGDSGQISTMCSKCSVLSLAKPAEMTAKLGTQVSWAVEK